MYLGIGYSFILGILGGRKTQAKNVMKTTIEGDSIEFYNGS